MKKLLMSMVLLVVATRAHGESLEARLDQVLAAVKKWETDRTLVAAVREQNQSGLTFEQIMARDRQWVETRGLDEGMKALLIKPASLRLLVLQVTKPYFSEMFLMDNQGAIVAMTNKTSDYWQGDEDKWIKSYNGGKGGIHIGDVEYDESAGEYLAHVAIPIKDNGKVIGALAIGVLVDELPD